MVRTPVTKLILWTTSGLTDPQTEYIRTLYDRKQAPKGEQALAFIGRLIEQVQRDISGSAPPGGVCVRGDWKGNSRVRASELEDRSRPSAKDGMDQQADAGHKKTSKASRSQPLPNPFSQPEKIVRPSQVSIIYLGECNCHVTQCSIAGDHARNSVRISRRPYLPDRPLPRRHRRGSHIHSCLPGKKAPRKRSLCQSSGGLLRRDGGLCTGLMLISLKKAGSHETIISQGNSYLIGRLAVRSALRARHHGEFERIRRPYDSRVRAWSGHRQRASRALSASHPREDGAQ